jgi:hypothetical protein
VLVDSAQADLLVYAEREGMACWAMVGVGRLLPAALFEEVKRRVVSDDGVDSQLAGIEAEFSELFTPIQRIRPRRGRDEAVAVEVDRITAVIGPRGKAVPAIALKRADCIAPAEILGFSSLSL